MPEATSWEEIDKLSPKEKKAFFKPRLQTEPITRFSDIKIGDHLIRKTSYFEKPAYYHHFLCIGFINDKPIIIHHYTTVKNAASAFLQTGSFGCGSVLGKFSSIQKMSLPHEDFLKNEDDLEKEGAEVERVIWPDELKRYSVEEVIQRAERRLGETSYDLVDNNCESFVMWCICGSNVSLQSATLWVKIPVEVIKGFIMMLFQGAKQLPKFTMEFVERALNCTFFGNEIAEQGVESLSFIGCTVGTYLALIVELACIVYCMWEIQRGVQTGNPPKERIEKAVKELLVHLFRFGTSSVGCLVGQILIPIPYFGGLLGLFGSSLLGHFAGKAVPESASKSIADAWEKWYCALIGKGWLRRTKCAGGDIGRKFVNVVNPERKKQEINRSQVMIAHLQPDSGAA